MGMSDIIGPGRSLLYNLDEEACAPPGTLDSFALKYGFSTAELAQMTMVARETAVPAPLASPAALNYRPWLRYATPRAPTFDTDR
eukprot:COSAG02_NODE_88_length_38629_cov_457.967999_17_plen_85_part_00